MRTWFTADLHLDHANIIKYCQRPFKDIEEMNYRLISNWNSRVKPEDTVFHIGDFCFKETKHKAQDFIDQLKGKIIFIKGNHDRNNGVNTPIEDLRITLGGKEFLLIHNPANGWAGFYLNLVGHVHQKWKCQTFTFEGKTYDTFNVGVDVHDFHPININEILKEYQNWKREDDKKRHPKK